MKTLWEKYTDAQLAETDAFAEEYRKFLSAAKTEREYVTEAVKAAEAAGFRSLETKKGKLKAGDRIYAVNRGKNLVLFVIGKAPLTEGMNILGAHIDSPRLDLKQHTLYEKDGLALLDTHYYGGIKK